VSKDPGGTILPPGKCCRENIADLITARKAGQRNRSRGGPPQHWTRKPNQRRTKKFKTMKKGSTAKVLEPGKGWNRSIDLGDRDLNQGLHFRRKGQSERGRADVRRGSRPLPISRTKARKDKKRKRKNGNAPGTKVRRYRIRGTLSKIGRRFRGQLE